MEKYKVLIIEDDKMLNNGIEFNLQMDGFCVLSALTLGEAKNLLKMNTVDIIILDVNLPDGSGFDFCKEVRKERDTPILFLSACDLEVDIITGFRIGGDDYITKPFSITILKERIFALLRRCGKRTAQNNFLKVGEFDFDFDQMTVLKNGKIVDLAPTEYKLLKKLVQSKGQVLTRETLLEVLWEKENFVEEHALTVNISRLRNKIEDNPSKPKYIKTVYGIGYVWGGEAK